MLQPADLLVLDEPTNDLDIPTLEVLEESLLEFPGAVVLVTHDRFLFERVTTTVLALDGNGTAVSFADYRQWEAAGRQATSPTSRERSTPRLAPTDPPAKRLSWKEQREWEGIEASILAAEAKLAGCQEAAHDPTIATDAAELAARWQDVEEARAVIDRLYARWAELDVKRG
jgi:ATP-binding cassette subfamily F protein uup